MTEVKICGITNGEDSMAAASAGADAVGFIFYSGSSRFVTPERAREISQRLPRKVSRVGVFVDQDPEEVRRIARFCGLDFIQLHGKESPDYCRLFSPAVLIKAVSLGSEEDLDFLSHYPVRAILADSRGPAQPGDQLWSALLRRCLEHGPADKADQDDRRCRGAVKDVAQSLPAEPRFEETLKRLHLGPDDFDHDGIQEKARRQRPADDQSRPQLPSEVGPEIHSFTSLYV